MSFKVQGFSSIPTSMFLPAGNYHLRIAGFESTYSKKGLAMFVVNFRVVSPLLCENRGHTEYLVIGKRPFDVEKGAPAERQEYAQLDDPDGENPLTQMHSRGLKTLKRILIALEHPLAGADEFDIDELIDDFNMANPKDQPVIGAVVSLSVDKDGRERNNITYFAPQDKVEPGLTETKATAKASKPAQKPQPTKTRTRAAVDYDEDDLDG